jgi:hypothetical protein
MTVVLGKVASKLAVNDDRLDPTSNVQRIADILPLVLAKYGIHETQPILRVECSPSNLMPSQCVSA